MNAMAYKQISREWCAYVSAYKEEFICDTDADFAQLPECSTGSAALSVASGKVRVVNASGEWVDFGA
jgi:hypothetical protein